MSVPIIGRHTLLFGPYRPPSLRVGDRASCLVRDCDVIVTSWTAARISWPRCRGLDSGGGGSGLLVDEELARAIRNESAGAIGYWWGVGGKAVARWRRLLGVTLTNNPESYRLIHAAAKAGGAAMRERGLTEEEEDERSERSKRLNLARYMRPSVELRKWPETDVALLGTMPDDEVAGRIGKTVEAVRLKRQRLGISNPADRRRREHNAGGPRAKRREKWPADYQGPRELRRVRR